MSVSGHILSLRGSSVDVIMTGWYLICNEGFTGHKFVCVCVLSSSRSSFACGLAGALASNPVDVVRTRMMNQKGVALYQGTLDCILQVSQPPLVPVQVLIFPPNTNTLTGLGFQHV